MSASGTDCGTKLAPRHRPLRRGTSLISIDARARVLARAVARAAAFCVALPAFSALAQDGARDEPTIAVTGVGRALAAPDQAVVILGATVQRDDARDAQRELDAVMRETAAAIRQLGIAAEDLQTAGLSLTPVYAELADAAARNPAEAARRDEPRIVAYRATNVLQVTVDDLAIVGAVVDAGIAAGVNEIRNVSFRLADELPHRVTALERAVEAARLKARAAAAALGARLGEALEVRERSVAVPYVPFDAAFARAESATPLEPGEIEIEATVDVSFRLVGTPSASGD